VAVIQVAASLAVERSPLRSDGWRVTAGKRRARPPLPSGFARARPLTLLRRVAQRRPLALYVPELQMVPEWDLQAYRCCGQREEGSWRAV
jgi:hypothetical protein